jgi:hypothetical protein
MLFLMNRQTDMRKLIVTFHDFANVPKKMSLILTVATHHKMSTSVNPLPAAAVLQLTLVGQI